MKAQQYLHNQLLIAMPNLADPAFSHTVSYLCQHNEEGALAIVVNKPTGMTLGTILDQMGIHTSSDKVNNTPVFMGGPVQQERGFIIHSTNAKTWDSSISTSNVTSLTSSRDILEAIAEDKGSDQYLVALGYAGWGAGQLEKEIIHNAWLTMPCEENILYTTPIEQRWSTAAKQIGVDISQLTINPGHG